MKHLIAPRTDTGLLRPAGRRDRMGIRSMAGLVRPAPGQPRPPANDAPISVAARSGPKRTVNRKPLHG